jgi:hypothetical protein
MYETFVVLLRRLNLTSPLVANGLPPRPSYLICVQGELSIFVFVAVCIFRAAL